MKVIAVTTSNGRTTGVCEFQSKKQAIDEITKVWGWKRSPLSRPTFYGCLAGVIGYQNARVELYSVKEWEAGIKYAF